MEEKQDYMLEYEEFSNNFKRTEIAPEEVGELIMKMAGHYARHNIRYADKLRIFSVVMAELINSPDPQTGKAMSASKAEILGEATPECADYTMEKIHINNLQEYINGLKSLQKSLMVEYGHVQ